jgi:drug/metabolite transporter (DMT)-like permease
MEYALLLVADFLYSLMFLTNRGYQRNNGTGLKNALTFTTFTSGISLMIFLLLAAVAMISGWDVLSEFAIQTPTWFSVLFVVLGAGVSIGYSFFSIKALGVANLSLYSIFAMLGGMLLPSIYGLIFSGEPMTWGKAGCYTLIIVALLLTFEKGKQEKKAIFYCFGVFVLNGMSGVVTSIHKEEIFSHIAVNSGTFMILGRIATALICIVLLLIINKKLPRLKLADIGNVAGNAACGGMGNLLQYLVLATFGIGSSVLFPIVTGGTMLFSMVVSLVIGEKPKAKTIIASCIAAASTILMMF